MLSFIELMRWKTVVPLAVPHMATADTVVQGAKGEEYLLPKGAWIMPNLHMMDHDASRFDAPTDFDPQRHFADNKKLKPDETVAFGIGKRRCVGEIFAQINIQLVIAHVIWLFQVQRADGDRSVLNDQTYGGELPARAKLKRYIC